MSLRPLFLGVVATCLSVAATRAALPVAAQNEETGQISLVFTDFVVPDLPPPLEVVLAPVQTEVPAPLMVEIAPTQTEVPAPLMVEIAPTQTEVPPPLMVEIAPTQTEVPAPLMVTTEGVLTEAPQPVQISLGRVKVVFSPEIVGNLDPVQLSKQLDLYLRLMALDQTRYYSGSLWGYRLRQAIIAAQEGRVSEQEVEVLEQMYSSP